MASISNNKNYYVQIKSRELDWDDLKAQRYQTVKLSVVPRGNKNPLG